MRSMMSLIKLCSVAVYLFSCSKAKDETVAAATSAAQTIGQADTLQTLSDGSTKISVPPGTLAVGTELSIAKGSDPEEFTAVFSSAPKASGAIVVSAVDSSGAAISTASGQIIIDIEFSDSLSLAADRVTSNLCVLGISQDGVGKYVWRRSFVSVDETKKLVRFATRLMGTYQLAFCGLEELAGFSESKTSAPAITEAAPTELDGIWDTQCTIESSNPSSTPVSIRTHLLIAGDRVDYQTMFYLDTKTCEEVKLYYAVRMSFEATFGGDAVAPAGAKKLDMKLSSAFSTPYKVSILKDGTAEEVDMASKLNEEKRCGVTTWENGRQQDITGKTCSREFTDKERTYYTIYKLNGTLCMGRDGDSESTGSSDALRPTEVSDDCLIRI